MWESLGNTRISNPPASAMRGGHGHAPVHVGAPVLADDHHLGRASRLFGGMAEELRVFVGKVEGVVQLLEPALVDLDLVHVLPVGEPAGEPLRSHHASLSDHVSSSLVGLVWTVTDGECRAASRRSPPGAEPLGGAVPLPDHLLGQVLLLQLLVVLEVAHGVVVLGGVAPGQAFQA